MRIEKQPNFEKDGVNFEMEDIKDLPEVGACESFGAGANKYAKLCTDNRVIAYLVKTHGQTSNNRGLLKARPYTDKQFETYIAYTQSYDREADRVRAGPVWPIWAKSIEVALTQSKTRDRMVDLEDVMAITRLGVEKVDEAKRISGSLDYKDYRDAKYDNGEFVIPKNEKVFINTWLSYYNSDVDL